MRVETNSTPLAPPVPPYFSGAGISGGTVQINANVDAGGPYAGYVREGKVAHSVTSALNLGGIIGSPQQANEFGFASPQQIHSGWAPEGQPGRIGYSVKFIGMDALTRTLRVFLNDAGTEGPIANPPVGYNDLRQVFH